MITFGFNLVIAFAKVFLISGGAFFLTWLMDKLFLRDIYTLGEIKTNNYSVAIVWAAIYFGNVVMFSLALFGL